MQTSIVNKQQQNARKRKVRRQRVKKTPAVMSSNKRQEKRKPRTSAQPSSKKEVNVKVENASSNLQLARTDARLANVSKVEVSLSNQLKTITISKNLDQTALTWLCMGYIARAYERGYNGFCKSIYNPFYALRFMSNLIASYVQAQVVPVTELPYWLLCLGHAVSPKTIPFGDHGQVSYQFAINGDLPSIPTVTNVIGYQQYGYQFSVGWPTGTNQDGWPIISSSGSSYTDALGAAAFQELCQFMIDAKPHGDASRLVPSSMQTPFKNDVSAFAMFVQAEGLGATGSGGGLYGQCQLEVPVRHPLLALFSSVSDSYTVTSPYRNFNWSLPITGDACFLGAMMPILPTKDLALKRSSRLKPVDFFEFVEVVAMWVRNIIQAYFVKTAETLTATTAQKALCPLSLQEMMLLLRNVMMGAFKASQAAVQGIYPFKPISQTDNQFVPFVSSVGTCPLNINDMQLPVPLIENIRALTARVLKYGGSDHDLVLLMPVLGQYALDVLSSSDYQVTYTIPGGTATTVNAFATGPFFFKTSYTEKGAEVKVPMVEAAVNMIDGSYTSGMLMINDPERLKNLCSMWNDWLTTSGVQAFSVQTGTLGTEQGISILCSLGMTRIWAAGISEHFRRNQLAIEEGKLDTATRMKRSLSREAVKIVDSRMAETQYRALYSSPMASKKVIIDTSQGKLISAAYEQVQATWILPINRDETVVNQNSTLVQRWQFMMDESYSQPRTSGTTGISLSSLHESYAAKMTKADLAFKDDWTQFFEQCAATGRGGILSGLVAGLVGSIFPSAAPIANTIADIIPI